MAAARPDPTTHNNPHLAPPGAGTTAAPDAHAQGRQAGPRGPPRDRSYAWRRRHSARGRCCHVCILFRGPRRAQRPSRGGRLGPTTHEKQQQRVRSCPGAHCSSRCQHKPHARRTHGLAAAMLHVSACLQHYGRPLHWYHTQDTCRLLLLMLPSHVCQRHATKRVPRRKVNEPGQHRHCRVALRATESAGPGDTVHAPRKVGLQRLCLPLPPASGITALMLPRTHRWTSTSCNVRRMLPHTNGLH
jgi:hypothetical protein